MVSVVIPTLNAGSRLERMLIMLQRQTISPEIVIIDSSSSDDTLAIAKNYNCKILCIEKKDFNHGATRNIAARKSNGDVVVFMTQDSLPLNEYSIEILTKTLESPINVASYGRHICHQEAKPTERFSREHNYPDAENNLIIKPAKLGSTIRSCFFSNVFSAVKKKEFLEIGGFPEDVVMFEDMLLAAKFMMNGYSVIYVPEAKVMHSHNLSMKQQFKRYFQAGVSFRMNPWFLKNAKSSGEGFKFVKEQIKYLAKNGKCEWIPYAVFENACKFTGYRLGLSYSKLPISFVKRMTNL